MMNLVPDVIYLNLLILLLGFRLFIEKIFDEENRFFDLQYDDVVLQP